MKHHIIQLTIALLLICSFSSCEKVIDLNLDTSAPIIVIQGNVFDHDGPYKIQISKTVAFTESNIFPAVTDAKVTISDNLGNSEILTESSPGMYITSTLKGTPGVTYTLTVVAEGNTYTAVSTMPEPVEIYRIYIRKSDVGSNREVAFDFQDPPDIDNYYRVLEYINDSLKTGVNVGNDKLYPGKMITYSLGSSSLKEDSVLQSGDRVRIQFECIDKNVYEYFRTTKGNSDQSTSPTNPTSNISNGALGYFSACTVRQDSIIYH
jgi:hypothetical protein